MASNHSELAEMCGHILAAPIIPDYVMTIIQVCPLLFVNYHSNMMTTHPNTPMTMVPVGQVFALKNFFEMSIFLSLGVLCPGLHAWSPGQLSCDLRCASLLQNAHGGKKIILALNSC